MKDKADLFGYTPPQGNLFGSGENRMEAPRIDYLPAPQAIRVRLRGLLDKAKSATKMPWSDRDARMWQIVFPNMAKWLPEDEAAQLCFEFANEMERLGQTDISRDPSMRATG